MAFTERAEVSLGMGLATAAIVWGVFNTSLPSIAESRVTGQNDRDLASAERTATWVSGAVVAGVSLISKDATVFVLGGATVVALAWMHRHANQVHPGVGKATMPAAGGAGVPQAYSDNVYGFAAG
jgi:hypothetical protein